VKAFKAKIAGKYPGAVLAIERTHYDNSVLEVISPLNIRKVLKLSDGDECSVTAFLE
jgi:CTP-dependent riboflavin kinase